MNSSSQSSSVDDNALSNEKNSSATTTTNQSSSISNGNSSISSQNNADNGKDANYNTKNNNNNNNNNKTTTSPVVPKASITGEGKRRLIRTIRPIDVRKLQSMGLDRKIAEALSKQKQAKQNTNTATTSSSSATSVAAPKSVSTTNTSNVPNVPSPQQIKNAKPVPTTSGGATTPTPSSSTPAPYILNPTTRRMSDKKSLSVDKSITVKPIIPPKITITAPDNTCNMSTNRHMQQHTATHDLSPESRMKHVKSLLHKKLLQRQNSAPPASPPAFFINEKGQKQYAHLKPPSSGTPSPPLPPPSPAIPPTTATTPPSSTKATKNNKQFHLQVSDEKSSGHLQQQQQKSHNQAQKLPVKVILNNNPPPHHAKPAHNTGSLHRQQQQQHYPMNHHDHQWGGSTPNLYHKPGIGGGAFSAIATSTAAAAAPGNQSRNFTQHNQGGFESAFNRYTTSNPPLYTPAHVSVPPPNNFHLHNSRQQQQQLQQQFQQQWGVTFQDNSQRHGNHSPYLPPAHSLPNIHLQKSMSYPTLNTYSNKNYGTPPPQLTHPHALPPQQQHSTPINMAEAYNPQSTIHSSSNPLATEPPGGGIATAPNFMLRNPGKSTKNLLQSPHMGNISHEEPSSEITPNNKLATKPKTPQKSPQDIARKLDFDSQTKPPTPPTTTIAEPPPSYNPIPNFEMVHDMIYSKAAGTNDGIPKASVKPVHPQISIVKQCETSTPLSSSSSSTPFSTPTSSPAASRHRIVVPDVSPLKTPFPTANVPKEAPLPNINTFKKPYPSPNQNYFQMLVQNPNISVEPTNALPYHMVANCGASSSSISQESPSMLNEHVATPSTSSSGSLAPQNNPNSLIVLENKVLSQDEMIDLTALRLSKAPQRFARPHKPIPEVVIKQENPDDFPAAENNGTTQQQTNDSQGGKTSQQTNPPAATQQTLSTQTTNQQGMVLISSKQNKKIIVNASKLQLPPEKIADLAKIIAQRAVNKSGGGVTTQQSNKTDTHAIRGGDTSPNKQVTKPIPGQKVYLIVKKDSSRPLAANHTEKPSTSGTSTTAQASPTKQLPHNPLLAKPEELNSSPVTEIKTEIPPYPSKLSYTPTKYLKPAVEIIDDSTDDDDGDDNEQEASFSAVDFIASLAQSNPITEETQLELSPEELNLNASCAMNLSPLRIPFPSPRKRHSSTSQFTTPGAEDVISGRVRKNSFMDIGKIVTMPSDQIPMVDTIIIESSKGRDVLRKSFDENGGGGGNFRGELPEEDMQGKNHKYYNEILKTNATSLWDQQSMDPNSIFLDNDMLPQFMETASNLEANKKLQSSQPSPLKEATKERRPQIKIVSPSKLSPIKKVFSKSKEEQIGENLNINQGQIAVPQVFDLNKSSQEVFQEIQINSADETSIIPTVKDVLASNSKEYNQGQQISIFPTIKDVRSNDSKELSQENITTDSMEVQPSSSVPMNSDRIIPKNTLSTSEECGQTTLGSLEGNKLAPGPMETETSVPTTINPEATTPVNAADQYQSYMKGFKSRFSNFMSVLKEATTTDDAIAAGGDAKSTGTADPPTNLKPILKEASNDSITKAVGVPPTNLKPIFKESSNDSITKAAGATSKNLKPILKTSSNNESGSESEANTKDVADAEKLKPIEPSLSSETSVKVQETKEPETDNKASTNREEVKPPNTEEDKPKAGETVVSKRISRFKKGKINLVQRSKPLATAGGAKKTKEDNVGATTRATPTSNKEVLHKEAETFLDDKKKAVENEAITKKKVGEAIEEKKLAKEQTTKPSKISSALEVKEKAEENEAVTTKHKSKEQVSNPTEISSHSSDSTRVRLENETIPNENAKEDASIISTRKEAPFPSKENHQEIANSTEDTSNLGKIKNLNEAKSNEGSSSVLSADSTESSGTSTSSAPKKVNEIDHLLTSSKVELVADSRSKIGQGDNKVETQTSDKQAEHLGAADISKNILAVGPISNHSLSEQVTRGASISKEDDRLDNKTFNVTADLDAATPVICKEIEENKTPGNSNALKDLSADHITSKVSMEATHSDGSAAAKSFGAHKSFVDRQISSLAKGSNVGKSPTKSNESIGNSEAEVLKSTEASKDGTSEKKENVCSTSQDDVETQRKQKESPKEPSKNVPSSQAGDSGDTSQVAEKVSEESKNELFASGKAIAFDKITTTTVEHQEILQQNSTPETNVGSDDNKVNVEGKTNQPSNLNFDESPKESKHATGNEEKHPQKSQGEHLSSENPIENSSTSNEEEMTKAAREIIEKASQETSNSSANKNKEESPLMSNKNSNFKRSEGRAGKKSKLKEKGKEDTNTSLKNNKLKTKKSHETPKTVAERQKPLDEGKVTAETQSSSTPSKSLPKELRIAHVSLIDIVKNPPREQATPPPKIPFKRPTNQMSKLEQIKGIRDLLNKIKKPEEPKAEGSGEASKGTETKEKPTISTINVKKLSDLITPPDAENTPQRKRHKSEGEFKNATGREDIPSENHGAPPAESPCPISRRRSTRLGLYNINESSDKAGKSAKCSEGKVMESDGNLKAAKIQSIPLGTEAKESHSLDDSPTKDKENQVQSSSRRTRHSSKATDISQESLQNKEPKVLDDNTKDAIIPQDKDEHVIVSKRTRYSSKNAEEAQTSFDKLKTRSSSCPLKRTRLLSKSSDIIALSSSVEISDSCHDSNTEHRSSKKSARLAGSPRKKLRKTLDDIKKSHKIASDSEEDDDRDFDITANGYDGEQEEQEDPEACCGASDFLGFEDNSSSLGSKTPDMLSIDVQEKKSPIKAATTKGGTLKNWLTTGKAISPTSIKDRAAGRQRQRSVPLKKRWDVQKKSIDETDITDDSSPANDEEEEEAEEEEKDLKEKESKRSKRSLKTVIDSHKDAKSAKKKKLGSGDATKPTSNGPQESSNQEKLGEKLEQLKANKLTETDSDTPVTIGKRTKRPRRRLISSDFDTDSKVETTTAAKQNAKAAISESQEEDNHMSHASASKRGKRKSKVATAQDKAEEKSDINLDTTSLNHLEETDDLLVPLPSKRKRRLKKMEQHDTDIPGQNDETKTPAQNNDNYSSSNRYKTKHQPMAADEEIDSDTPIKTLTNKNLLEPTGEDSSLSTPKPKGKRGRKKKILIDLDGVSQSSNAEPKTPAQNSENHQQLAANEELVPTEEDPSFSTPKPKGNRGRKKKILTDLDVSVSQSTPEPKTPAQNPENDSATTSSVKKFGRPRILTAENQFNWRLLLVTKREQLDTDEVLTAESKPGSGPIQCGLCLQRTTEAKWIVHLSQHYGVGWRIGETEVDTTYRPAVLAAIINFFKDTEIKGMPCRMCNRLYRSGLGLLSHVETCGLGYQRADCEYCKRNYSVTSLAIHIRSCPAKLNQMKATETTESDNVVPPEEQVLSVTGRAKRHSTIKAESKIKQIGAHLVNTADEGKSEFNPLDHIRYQAPLAEDSIRAGWSAHIEKFGKACCPLKWCQFSSDKIEELDNHIKSCRFLPKVGYHCTACKRRPCYETEEQAIAHVRATHRTSEDFSQSDSDCNIKTDDDQTSDDDAGDSLSDAVDEDENELDDVEESKNSKRRSKKKSTTAYRPFVQGYGAFRKRVYARRIRDGPSRLVLEKWQHFTNSNYSTKPLFVNFKVQFSAFKNPNWEKYLPNQNISMKFAMSKKKKLAPAIGLATNDDEMEWTQIERFQNIQHESDAFCFVGAPVICCTWIPLPNDVKEQYLLIAYRKDIFKFTKFQNPKRFKTSLVLFKVTRSKISGKKVPQLRLHYAIALEDGPVYNMAFLPSGGYCLKTNRLGLMAVATASSNVNVYSLPIDFSADEEVSKDLPIIELKPSFELKLDITCQKGDSEDHILMNPQCMQVIWSEFSGHNHIFASYSNGCVGVWDVSDDAQENLNRFEVNGVIQYAPINYFFVGEKGIRKIALQYDTCGPRWLAVHCFCRKFIIYDIRNFSLPIPLKEEFARNIVRDMDWSPLWEPIMVAYCDSIPNNGRSVLLINPTNIMAQQQKLDYVISAATGVHFNPWTNMCVESVDNGDIVFMDCREMHYEQVLGRKFGERRILSSMDIMQLNGEPLKRLTDVKENEKFESEWSLYEHDYKDKYGLVFQPFIKLKESLRDTYLNENRRAPINIVPFMRINSLRCNLNRSGKSLVAVGYENGFIRVINFDKDSQFSNW
ncbi:uncharacterized protein [Musca autumnalis]|uniref:uncharacterized protein n=1 Tax=Musca autumnalis TaxID=221902 RepID=UPI003CF949C7